MWAWRRTSGTALYTASSCSELLGVLGEESSVVEVVVSEVSECVGALTIYRIYLSLSKRPSPKPLTPTDLNDPIDLKDPADLIDADDGLLDPENREHIKLFC